MHETKAEQILLELSLAIGDSLDAEASAISFLGALRQWMEVDFASIWHRQPAGGYQLSYASPPALGGRTYIEDDQLVPATLNQSGYQKFVLPQHTPAEVMPEYPVEAGEVIVFSFRGFGFLKIFGESLRPYSTDFLDQLHRVVIKFGLSIDACMVHEHFREEHRRSSILQEQLEQSASKYEDLFERMYDALIITDQHGNITSLNQSARRMLGYPEHGNPRIHISSLVHPQDQEHSKRYLKKLKTDGYYSGYQGRIITLTGQIRYVEVNSNAILSQAGEMIGSRDIVRDITEQHLAEEALRKSEEKYRGIIENMELGLLEVDQEGRIVKAYDRFAEMLGYEPEELKGQLPQKVFLPEDYHPIISQQVQSRLDGISEVYELQLQRKDGERIWVLVSGTPIYDRSGKITGSLGIHYNITDRKQLEEKLMQAKARAERARQVEQQFLANMSHEIRTPMNAVVGMAHLLENTNPTEVQMDYLSALRFSADSLLSLIDNILDLSKIEAGEVTFDHYPFSLRQLMMGLERTFQFKVKDKPVSVGMELDERIDRLLMGDATRLSQILNNLLGNASKFTMRGSICFGAEMLEASEQEYTIRFFVSDTGIGIAKDKIEFVFENFKQADAKITKEFGGTGLGLAIVKQLIVLQGGDMRVESEESKGTLFEFTLSFSRSDKKDEGGRVADGSAVVDPEMFGDVKALVAEDNTMNQKLIGHILGNWSCDYDLAKDGEQAIRMSTKERYDFILMDIHMPKMDGVEATQFIRQSAGNPNHETLIIGLTAAALIEEKERAIKAGMDEFITKPFSPEALLKLIIDKLNMHKQIDYQSENVDPTHSGQSEVGISLDYLEEFSGGDKAFIREMIETFLQEAPRLLTQLTESAQAKDLKKVHSAAHQLKPNFMMLGMPSQQNMAIAIEKATKGELPESRIPSLTLQLDRDARAALKLLEQELQEL